ncbi:poly(3-hydroxyalkanoate) synthetase [Rhodoblastus acidophilus]|uniref:alpha/beta fold hydrolase n=1 Tax=Rhodoblastus acidophilus TaxID=1074 RepID=UPI002224471A|nr:alpha/beta fold hydrolase [Rhodoblastus acidophilus]MCW2284749.1 poly(3-hydroxyalkanoate) synthetase [Rhodoblastus acidophilus]MCW2333702.1 poly(3-hydroxyalkanoate) synthetase [Rhodoblastus acidophilus]
MRGGNPFAQDWAGLFLPGLAAAEAGAQVMRRWAEGFVATPPTPAPDWASANEIVLKLRAARLRRFGDGAGRPILVCAPFALHGAQITDLCPGHSLMQRLRTCGRPLYLIEWLSAGPDEAGRGIDDYLCDLNVLVGELGEVDFVGICQGGWLGLMFAARFPGRLQKIVLAGAPVDIEAGDSKLSRLAQSTSLETFRELVRLGGGLALGAHADRVWPQPQAPEDIHRLLQSDAPCDSEVFAASAEAFRRWAACTLDLPGVYYLEVVENFYRANALARGEFVALGKRINLRDIKSPLFMLAADQDEITAPAQTFACANLVGAPPDQITTRLAEGGHLSLFLGSRNLRNVWAEVVRWLSLA